MNLKKLWASPGRHRTHTRSSRNKKGRFPFRGLPGVAHNDNATKTKKQQQHVLRILPLQQNNAFFNSVFPPVNLFKKKFPFFIFALGLILEDAKSNTRRSQFKQKGLQQH